MAVSSENVKKTGCPGEGEQDWRTYWNVGSGVISCPLVFQI